MCMHIHETAWAKNSPWSWQSKQSSGSSWLKLAVSEKVQHHHRLASSRSGGCALVVVQSISRVWPYVTTWTAAHHAPLSFTVSQSLLKFMSIESVMLFNHLILCHPLLFLPSIFPSIRVFFSEWAFCIRWPEYWSFSVSPSNEYLELISFRIDWFDIFAVQGTLESFQHHNSKASILQSSAFFMVQLWALEGG